MKNSKKETQISNELNPCPFCGAKPYISQGETKYYLKHKDECYFYGKHNHGVQLVAFANDSDVIASWNTRPIEDALRKEISQLQADNISLVEQMNQMALKPNQEIIDWHNYPEEKPEPNGYMNRVLLVIYQHGITVGIATAEYFFPMFSDMQHELFEFGKLKGVKILAWAYLPKGVINEHKTN
jgi:hypothetical protein